MDLFHWEPFEPNIGTNRNLPADQRFIIEVACGLSKVELKAAKRALDFDALTPSLVECTALAESTKAPDETAEEALDRVVFGKVNDLSATKLAEGWAPFFRLKGAPLTINGKPIATLHDYLRCILEQPGRYNVVEMAKVLVRINSVEGNRELF